MPEQPGPERMRPMPGTCVVVEKETRRTQVGIGRVILVILLCANNVKEGKTCMFFQCVQMNFILI